MWVSCPQVDARHLFSLPPWSQGASLSPRLHNQMHWNEISGGRRQQEWAGTRVASGLSLGSDWGLRSSRVGWPGSGVWITCCDFFTATGGWLIWESDSFKPESLTICELPNILCFHFCFFHSRFVLLFVAQNSEWQAIRQMCKAKVMYSKNSPLKSLIPHIICNARPMVWHVPMLSTCISWRRLNLDDQVTLIHTLSERLSNPRF